ncbi:MAG: LLM class flavin-dependent oxidoreductase [Candidatus Lokiarchaeota archaeon]|nr:LLM class flavin-dependent oxidoreductase [Candidatus Lokiarchaeota archaeon]MBD3201666.1 LLM class flavin-dependent oxidoreductase [Candidatus Lokiarchaeota archaeon]
MDIDDIKIGTEGSIFGSIEKGIAGIKKIEKTGYDSIWMADHIMGWTPESIWTPDIIKMAVFQESPHLYYDVVSMMALAAENTKKVTLGTSVTETFRRHPAVLAQTFLTLDNISKGRVLLGIGAGEAENITPYGITFEKPVSRLEESLQIIKLLWESNNKVDYDGEFWSLKDAILAIKPFKKKKYPPIWIAAHGPKMLNLTGKYADGWLPAYSDPKAYKIKLNHVRNAAKKVGRDPTEITPGLFSYIVIDEDHNACDELIGNPYVKNTLLTLPQSVFEEYGVDHPLGKDFYGLTEYIPTKFDKDSIMEAIGKIPQKLCDDSVLHGTPDDVIGKIEDYAEVGLKHIVLTNITFMNDLSKVKSSFNGMKKVLSYFKG